MDTGKWIFIWLSFVWVSASILGQDLPSEVGPNLEIIEAGSYLIPMDFEKQSTTLVDDHYNIEFEGFNLAAYGLVHQFLEQEIPVQWVIKSGKEHDEIDVTAWSHEVYPEEGASAFFDYRSSLFVVKVSDIIASADCSSATLPGVDEIITQLGNDVSVYRLDEDTEMDIRFELQRQPAVAVLSDGSTNGGPHYTLLDEANIDYQLLSSEDFFLQYSCYTFISQPHLPQINNDQYIASLTNFLDAGGNFFAHCISVETFEQSGNYLTTNGLQATNDNGNDAYFYQNDDMPVMQFQGEVLPSLFGALAAFELDGGSNWKNNSYIGVTNQDDEYVLAAGDVNGVELGGNIYYISGHEINSECFEVHLSGLPDGPTPAEFQQIQQFKRTYLNATLVPANVSFTCAGTNQCICPGDEATIGCEGLPEDGAITYEWSPADGLSCTDCPNPIASPPVTTTYFLNTSDNCSSSEVRVYVQETFGEVSLLGGGDHCGEGIDLEVFYTGEQDPDMEELQVSLNGEAHAIYQVDSNPYTLTVYETGTYTVIFTDGTVCTVGYTGEAEVGNGEIFVDVEDQEICPGDTAFFSVDYGDEAEIIWSDGSVGNSFESSEPGNYSVSVAIGICVVTAEFELAFIEGDIIDIGPDQLACEGESVILNAGYEATWTGGTTGQSLEVWESGTYVASYQGDFCFVSDTVMVDFGNFDIDLGDDREICEGESTTLELDVPQSADIEWSDGSNGNELNIDEEGLYWVTIELGACVATDTIWLTFGEESDVDLINDLEACPGDTIVLDAGYEEVEWQDGTLGQFFTVVDEGEYQATYIGTLCPSDDDVEIEFISFNIDLGTDRNICEGQLVVLEIEAENGAQIEWQDGSSGNTFETNTPGIYWVEIQQGNCMDRDSVILSLADGALFQLGPDQSACFGDSIILDALYDEIIWQDGTLGQFYVAHQSGDYTATYTGDLCESEDQISLTFPDFAVDLGADIELCLGDSAFLNLDAPANAIIQWSDGSLGNEFMVDQEGTYWVDVQFNDCTASDSIELRFSPASNVDLGPDREACFGEPVLLDAGYEEVIWEDGSLGQYREVNFAGTYTATYNGNLCPSSDDIIVDFIQLDFNLGPDRFICFDEQANLTVNTLADAVITWQDGQQANVYQASQPGTYWVSVEYQGCVASDTVELSFLEASGVDLGPDLSDCDGIVITLDGGYQDIVWQDGTKGQYFEVIESGLYTATYDGDLCPTSDSIYVDFVSFDLDLGDNQQICPGDIAEFVVDIEPAASFIWQDGTEGNTFQVSSPGTYWVQVQSQACVKLDTVEVVFTEQTDIDLGADQTVCEGTIILLDAGYDEVVWQDGSVGQYYEVTGPGLYEAYYQGQLCASEDLVQLQYDPLPPQPELGPDLWFCRAISANIGVEQLPDLEYQWNTGALGSTIYVEQEGTYRLTISNECGSKTDSINVDTEIGEVGEDLYQLPDAFSPNDDGLNDLFYPIPMLNDPPSKYKFQVFNRWGNRIFYSEDPSVGWDGREGTTSGAIGVFLWMVDAEFEFCGQVENYFDYGNVTLIR